MMNPIGISSAQSNPSGYTWQTSRMGQHIPANAVVGGQDSDGTIIYVGRASHEGDMLPAKLMPTKNAGYVSHNGMEILKSDVEYLTGTGFSWVPSSNGNVPANAISSGKSRTGEDLYIGRTSFQSSVTLGKVHKSHGCLYFPYGGKEQSSKQYEVLVAPKRVEWVSSNTKSAIPAGAILAGNDADGSHMYIGRANYGGDQLVAKVLPSKKAAYVSHNGQEVSVQDYEILCNGKTRWTNGSSNAIPQGAVVGGRTSTGETLYVGRGRHNNSLTVGKIHPSHGSLYIPFNRAEIALKTFEYLIEI